MMSYITKTSIGKTCLRNLYAFIALCFIAPLTQATPKVFTVTVDEDVSLERVYEERDISFTILDTKSGDDFFTNGSVKGIAGLDPISGRMIVEINALSKSGMAMRAVGFVEDMDQEEGIDACTEWQSRMFEETKLCYAAKVEQGRQMTVILDPEDNAKMPVASGQ